MKLYFGNMVTTVTTLMILSLVGFVVYSISSRSNINYLGRRSLFVLVYGLVICCFAAARDGLDKTIQYTIDGSCNPGIFSLVSVKERIISEQECDTCSIYHQDFVEELMNIKTHANLSEYSGNMVHYVISSHSVETAGEMTELLVQNLRKANRINSRRMEIVSEIEPDLFRKKNHLEEIIENSYGGVIVLDLSEKFGYDPVDYVMASQYLEKLIKKYRNQCLFVFTYDVDHPGFAYYLLPQLKRYMMTIMLREGTGDRKAAVDYMQRLIEKSEYSKYAGQAQEFMALFPGHKFSQTDVLRAYEQFEACG